MTTFAATLLWGVSGIAQTPATSSHVVVKLSIPERSEPVQISVNFKGAPDDSGTFRTIHFTGAHAAPVSIVAKNELCKLVRSPSELGLSAADPIHGLVMDPSRLFFRGSYIAAGTIHTVLAFLGNGDFSGFSLVVVGFRDDGSPFNVFERDSYFAYSFEAREGGALFIGKESLSEGLWNATNGKASAATYDPYSVFLLQPGAPAVYGLAQSRAYNLAHYVWAGSQSSEKLVVFADVPGRSKLFVLPNIQAGILISRLQAQDDKHP